LGCGLGEVGELKPGLVRRKLNPNDDARSIWARNRPTTASVNMSEDAIFRMIFPSPEKNARCVKRAPPRGHVDREADSNGCATQRVFRNINQLGGAPRRREDVIRRLATTRGRAPPTKELNSVSFERLSTATRGLTPMSDHWLQTASATRGAAHLCACVIIAIPELLSGEKKKW